MDAHDLEVHRPLADRFDTASVTGEILSCLEGHHKFLQAGTDFIQPDAPHFAVKIHLHLAPTCGLKPGPGPFQTPAEGHAPLQMGGGQSAVAHGLSPAPVHE